MSTRTLKTKRREVKPPGTRTILIPLLLISLLGALLGYQLALELMMISSHVEGKGYLDFRLSYHDLIVLDSPESISAELSSWSEFTLIGEGVTYRAEKEVVPLAVMSEERRNFWLLNTRLEPGEYQLVTDGGDVSFELTGDGLIEVETFRSTRTLDFGKWVAWVGLAIGVGAGIIMGLLAGIWRSSVLDNAYRKYQEEKAQDESSDWESDDDEPSIGYESLYTQ